MLNKWQSIIRTNNGLFQGRIYASFRLDVFNYMFATVWLTECVLNRWYCIEWRLSEVFLCLSAKQQAPQHAGISSFLSMGVWWTWILFLFYKFIWQFSSIYDICNWLRWRMSSRLSVAAIPYLLLLSYQCRARCKMAKLTDRHHNAFHSHV